MRAPSPVEPYSPNPSKTAEHDGRLVLEGLMLYGSTGLGACPTTRPLFWAGAGHVQYRVQPLWWDRERARVRKREREGGRERESAREKERASERAGQREREGGFERERESERGILYRAQPPTNMSCVLSPWSANPEARTIIRSSIRLVQPTMTSHSKLSTEAALWGKEARPKPY